MARAIRQVPLEEIWPWRERYRHEMDCQIVHEARHTRGGWAEEYLLEENGRAAGYGSVLVGGPWTGTRTVFELYVALAERTRAFEWFETLVADGAASHVKAQTNDRLLTVLLHAYARDIRAEAVVLADHQTTALPAGGAIFRKLWPEERETIFPHRHEPVGDHGLEFEGKIVASGGLLQHYNPPYADLFMEVEEAHRRRGFGAYLVQELKRVAYAGGNVPGARCDVGNVASRRTCQKAGFAPCALIETGTLGR